MTAQKKDLLATLRLQYLERKNNSTRPTISKPPDKPGYDFSDHPDYMEVRIGLAASETIGVASPFFRQIDDVEGTRVSMGGKWVDNFASYDYLGMNGSDSIRTAASDAIARWGVSATASRLVGGERSIHAELEQKIASFVGTGAALVFVSGHATNLAILRTLVGKGDLVVVDALAHNSIYEGIRASGAAHVIMPHNDWSWVDEKMGEIREEYRNVLIAIEGLYSMDGDAPDLNRFVDVKSRHDAWLLVDEAHSIGVLGKTGRGICEEQGVDPARVDVMMGTLSKSFCSCGGYVAGSKVLIDLMRYKAPGFVYSVGLSMPNTAAAIAAVDLLSSEPERAVSLRELGEYFLNYALGRGLDCGSNQGYAVAPIIIGDSLRATWVSNRLLEAGVNALPIIAPAVPNKNARLRFFLNVGHTIEQIEHAIDQTARLIADVSDMSVTEIKEN